MRTIYEPQFGFLIHERKRLFWVSAILFLAFLLRVWGISSESAWIDEAYSIVLAQHSPIEIIQGTAADQHPPFYYLLLHSWFLFGEGVVYARWLSVLLGLLGVYQTIVFAENVGGYTLGLLSGLLVAISPIHIWYSQEARMYILLGLLTTSATHLLWKNLHEENKYYWFYYGFLTLLAFYTHYMVVFVVLVQSACVLFFSLQKKQFNYLIQWTKATTVAGIFFLPWIPIALYQSQAHTLEWVSPPTLAIARNVFLQVIFGGSIQALPDWGHTVLFLFVGGSIIGGFFWIKKGDRRLYIFLASLSIFVFALVALISLVYPIFQYKQFIIILTPLLILLAWAVKNLPRYWGAILFVTMFFLATATAIYQAVSITKDDWEGATAYLQTHSQAEDVIFGNPAAISLATSIYEQKSLSPIGYPSEYNIITGGWEGDIITEKIADNVLQNATQGKKRVWLVEYFPLFWDPDNQLEKWLAQHGKKDIDQYFGQIRIRLYYLIDGGENLEK